MKPEERTARLRALRDSKMSESAHAFVRASAPLFYASLGGMQIPAGPDIWISGDAHAENIGAVGSAKGEVELGLNDFDETVIGAPAHDLLRLGLSLTTVARTKGLGGAAITSMLASLVEGYEVGLLRGSSKDDRRAESLAELLREAVRADRRQLLRKMTGEEHPKELPETEKLWPLAEGRKNELAELVARDDVQELVRQSDPKHAGSVKLLDAAFRVAGTASLGGFRAALLVEVEDAPRADRLRVLDVKEAQPTSTPRRAGTPKDEAERALTGARALSPAYGGRKLAVLACGHRCLLRELMPQERKVECAALEAAELADVARGLAHVVGRAHGRQLAAKEARSWCEDVSEKRVAGTAPRWFSRALAPLVGIHESAYLKRALEGT